ncbi:dephospho-CoA kinase [Acidithiobacillus sp. CV18-2]|uniref:Dephospho-CoA kinase n=1 Tax=Igneacidithiobacillus copahuensis TaxID=2724909 RepID=A0AAE2YNW8_9PROT|nr:dephospho-CoA kinase [Igneacidithiobacillus copahuensis]MBU2754472.1 dephospho-CoA kinase [Acidithiobacillus sp. CV18-3]MBU2756777.1 dephospho-CoA kinase [Acidithiobacillus sp. BN09-2]MBU2778344.1 dephospho-CoA kinase [Acidithiobacillus sp. CV18-2]MBU2797615.1 dephospho-CoA kinase [Acidithiobacillus sp. VAN18-2]MBU2797944.1 dephospho-CoA kinase [Acidithiobacillus sp. VAN18-4]UTV80792.1 dephospho-CoA kinase [Acidithiobacillus sp. YTS05]
MSRRIGVTGGIACGKSLAADFLQLLGAKILDADLFARELVAPGHPNLERIAKHFGARILHADGSLDRAQLRQIIFSDIQAKQWLEELLHPKIRERFLAESTAIGNQDPAATILWVVPLLVENRYAELLDGVLLIDCPVSLQIERLAQRGWDLKTAQAAIAQQIHPEERRLVATWILPNGKSPADLQLDLQRWWQALHP